MDETGRWLATTEKIDLNGQNDSDRDYFQHHKGSPSREAYIGQPVKGRPGDRWIVTISRRVNHEDGSFAGVVLATIDVAYFANYYRQFDVGKTGAISLLNSKGILLARSIDNAVGRDLSAQPIFSRGHNGPPEGTLIRSVLDGLERMSVFVDSQRFPIALVVRQTKDEVLASWWREIMIQIFFVCCIVALIALMGVHLIRRLMERQRMATALAAKEADFRLLAEECSDVVMRIDVNEKVVYVSPACESVLGWTPEQLQGTPALGAVHEDDLPRAQETLAALKSGEIAEARMIYRKRHPTKGDIWLETALRATQGAKTGAIDGIVGICRDVTEQKNIELELDMLALSDSLTNLANRRQFDETLATEWARAKRDNTELGLLLMDVDHFKRYNDRFGHQAGDDCLRTVALVIASQAQRAGDLAARYGGEEFALLLPNTDKSSCQKIAANIRNALYDLDIEHADNELFGRVTISIGGAAVYPAAVTMGASALVESADAALYTAKNSGRNAVRIAGQIIPLDATRRRA